MKLSDFEQYLDGRILQRGLDYFHRGNVKNLEAINDGHYTAEVDGTDFYTVEVWVNQDMIVDTSCDCPYDLGEFCKHQAAVFYALKEKKSKNDKTIHSFQVGKQDLKSILSGLKKEELINIIYNLSMEDPNIEKQLLYQYAPAKDEISSSKKLIKEYIQLAKKRGFIEWNQVNYALQGADLVLQKAQEKIESGETETAVSLGMAVLSNVVDMLNFSDDSNGTVGSVIRTTINTMEEAIESAIDFLNQTEQKKLFELIVKEALHNRYDDWSEWRMDLLGLCISFCNNIYLRTKLESHLEMLMKKTDPSSWSSEYDKKELKKLQLAIFEQFDDPEKVERFIYDNIHHSDFREKVILLEMKKRVYDKVISLCLEGEKANQRPGLVKQWKEYRYQAYEQLGDVENQKELAKELLFGNDFGYYSILKRLYSLNEWKEELSKIVEEFQKQPYQTDAYLSILKAEQLTEQILEYCKSWPSNITNLYPYLIESYFEEVNQLFIRYIRKEAEKASDRKKYKNVCKEIKTYKNACGDIHSRRLIGELKEMYQRRPAFVDELLKIK